MDGWGEAIAEILKNNLVPALGNLIVFVGMCLLTVYAITNKDCILGLSILRFPPDQSYACACGWTVGCFCACLAEG